MFFSAVSFFPPLELNHKWLPTEALLLYNMKFQTTILCLQALLQLPTEASRSNMDN